MSRFIPDPSFRLTAEERARIPRLMDADAVERLLSMVPVESRPELFLGLIPPPNDGIFFRCLTSLSDPALQAALDEVWQPYWAGMTDEEMEREPDFIPGRDLARRIRAEQD